ncbi:DUF4097 family beta strand repeat-containing protein [Rhodocaloribacter sp.]
MNHSKMMGRVGMATLMLLGLTACGKGTGVGETEEGSLVLGASEATATVTRAVAPGARMLVIDGFAGNVALTGVDDDVARLTFTKQARGNDETAARRALGRIHIEENGDEATYRFALRADAPKVSRVDVTGTVPRGTTLRILLNNGNVALTDLQGSVSVNGENGDVQITGAGAAVEVATRNGSIAVGMARLTPEARVRLTTVNGDLTLALPPDASARVDARTNAGEIRADGLTFAERSLDPVGAGGHFRGTLGAGDAVVELRTENGDVTLYAGSLKAAPPRPAVTPADTTAAPADALATPADTTAMPAAQSPPPDTTAAPGSLTPPDTTGMERSRP